MVKVSVLVPVYNVEKYLEKCINSILEQTLSEIEIICIDDGSTDASGRILDDLSKNHARLKVIHNKNIGYGATMNFGLSLANGEYIGIVESDDFIERDMYEDLYRIAKEKDLDFAKGDYWKYTEEGKCLISRSDACQSDTVFSRYENMDKIFAPKSIWSGIYKKEFLVKSQIYFLETPGASYQDTSFWFKVCIMAERGYFVSKAYVDYRVDNDMSSVKSKEKVYCVCDELKECERYLWESGLDVGYLYPYYVFYKMTTYHWNLERLSSSIFCEDYVKRISRELKEDVAHLYMKKDGFYEDWCYKLKMITDFPVAYLKFLNERFIKIVVRKMKDIMDIVKEEKTVYIYGAGVVGHRLKRAIKGIAPDRFVQYVISDKEEALCDDVLPLGSDRLDVECNIILAVVSPYVRQEMTVRAINRGFEKIVFLDEDVCKILRDMDRL